MAEGYENSIMIFLYKVVLFILWAGNFQEREREKFLSKKCD